LIGLLNGAAACVVYRCSPLQKAQIVRLVKNRVPHSVTLAIGDGANDVNMIQNAHIGVGVMGKEGNQASTYSDYAIPQFRMLQRLVFWHGRGFGVRFSHFVKWFEYKSVNLAFVVLFMNTLTLFSAQQIHEDLFYSLYMVTLTNIALIAYTLMDQDVPFQCTNREELLPYKLSALYKH
jgi:magnesium-transporting ATPase (P-type)